MRANTSSRVAIKAAHGIRSLDALLEVMELGVTRIGATQTEAIIEGFRARKGGRVPVGAGAAAASDGGE
jgi:deoxyribose-phosphate aldolase